MTVDATGDYGKPRPALIVQSDLHALHPSVTILPLTSELHDLPFMRVTVEPGTSGLRVPSQVMVDKATTVPRQRVGNLIGQIEPPVLAAVDRALAAFLGLGR